jgi:hypothetical protein
MKISLGLVVWLAAAAAVHAAAAPGVPTYQELQKMFRQIDRSENGAIDAFEWREASEGIFRLTDLNHDDFLDETELAANTRLRAAYPELGTFRRGVIGRTEFLTMRQALFFGGDIDRNDYISPVEYEILVLVRHAGWNDRNGDERINMTELRTILGAAFALLDANADGVLAVDETPFLSPHHRAEMDPDGTGRISLDQLVNGYRWLLGADTSNKNRRRPGVG